MMVSPGFGGGVGVLGKVWTQAPGSEAGAGPSQTRQSPALGMVKL